MTIIFYSITYLYKFSRFYQILLYAHSIEWKIQLFPRFMHIKFIYSEKATKFYKIFTLLLSYVVPVKSKLKISQNFVAFSEYMNFNQPQNDPCIQFGLVQAHLGLSYFTSNNLILMHLHCFKYSHYEILSYVAWITAVKFRFSKKATKILIYLPLIWRY